MPTPTRPPSGRRPAPPRAFVGGLGAYGYATRRDLSSWARPLPVADVDRAKAFYLGLGWRLDIDFKPSPDTRGVQITPPGSPTSIQFGQGATTMTEPLQGMFRVVDDIEAARDDLISRGVAVSEIWHIEPGVGRVAGLDPQRRSYFSRASFADPDGNTWLLQEIPERLPGRV
jgi:catechol 2,3-dioxygenase-like lactoylglutathione lyase family enzyme